MTEPTRGTVLVPSSSTEPASPWSAPAHTAPLPPQSGQAGWPPPPVYWPPQQQEWPPPVPPRRPRLMIIAIVVGLVLMLAVATGAFLLGRAMRPSAQSSTSGGQGAATAPYNPFNNGGTGSGSGNSGNSGSTGSGPTADQVNAIAAKVDPFVVDINTELGYSSGRAAGTGIVLTSDGIVLTNNHVVAGATSISVTDVGNGKTYTASVVGYDRSHDVAVIKLSGASGLATANIGDSSKVNTGDQIVAIGNAGGTGGTPSAAGGTVSALNQSITAQDESTGSAEQLTGLIEVAANIQSGDSGGPLVNTSGQVVGIDTAASTSFQYQDQAASSGDGFAIPINQAVTLARQIEAQQASSTVHIGATAFLGIETGSQGAQNVAGATVLGTVSGSPAANAGLARGDVITAVGGKTVASPTDLTRVLDGYHPGDRVKVTWTDTSGSSHTATVTLAMGPVG